MDLFENMKNKIEEYLKLQGTLREELKTWVLDESIPLEERWEVFISSDLGDHSPWIEDFHPLVREYYLGRDYRRHETIEIYRIDENYQEELWEKYHMDKSSEEIEDIILNDKTLQEFRRAAMKEFIKSFELDW